MKVGNKKQVQCNQVDMKNMHERNLTKQPTPIKNMTTMIKTISNDHPNMQAIK